MGGVSALVDNNRAIPPVRAKASVNIAAAYLPVSFFMTR